MGFVHAVVRALVSAALCVMGHGAALASPTEGTLVVLNKAGQSASLIALRDGREVARVPTGAGPHEAAISPDGRTLVVTNYGQQTPGDTLTVIDVARARVLRTVKLDGYTRPHGVQFVSDDRVLVTAETQRALLVVDVMRSRVVHAIETAQAVSHMVATDAKRTRAWVANIGSGSATAIDLDARRVLAQVPTAAGAEGIDVTPDGREVWVSNREADTVSVIDARTHRVVASIPAPGFPIRVRFTPDGRRALVTAPKADRLLVFDVAARTLERSVALPGADTTTEGRLMGSAFGAATVPIGVVATRDGRHAFVAQAHADQVAVIDLENGRSVRTLRTGAEPDGLAWTPVEVGRDADDR